MTPMTCPTRDGPADCARVIIPIGMIMPPASPWSTRKAISDSALHDSPHRPLVITKPVTTVIQTRRGP